MEVPEGIERHENCRTSTGRGQAPQNSKLAELRPEYFQRLVPPILNFAVPDPGQMLFCTRYGSASYWPHGIGILGL